jgi:serine/threonine-protein kinase
MPRRTPLLALAALAISLATASGARAQVAASDAALAEKLFSDARDLMAKGQYAEACAKLVDSERLDPAVGTLLNLAECFEKSNRTASAWAIYREAESAATRRGQQKRAQFAAGRAQALAPNLAYLVIDAPPPPSAPAGLEVACDDKPLGGSFGAALPFDAGVHKVVAKAPGKKPWSTSVELADKATLHVAVPALEDAPAEPPPAPVIVLAPPPRESGPPPGQAQRVTGIVAGAVGLVGVGLGSYFGLRAKSANDEAEASHCDPTTCDQAGEDLKHDARSRATASTVAFLGGGLLLVAGAIVYFTAPHTLRAAKVGVAPGGLSYAF